MEGVGQKKGDGQIVFYPLPFQLHSRFQEKPAIVSIHCVSGDHHCSLVPHAYFAEQLSLRWCAVRYRACGQDRELQEAWRSARRTPVSAMKVCAAPGDEEETIPVSCCDDVQLDDNCVWLCHCVSVVDQMHFFLMPRFCQTCGRKYGAPCGGRSATRGPTEQQPIIIMIRRMAQRNPSRIARNFETTALSGQP